MLEDKYVRTLDPFHLDVIDGYTNWLLSHRAESTAERRVHYAGRIALWAQEQEKRVFQLNHLEVATWLTKKVGPKPNTKSSAKASASMLFNWGIEAQLVSSNPVHRLPTIRRPRALPRPCPENVLNSGLSNATRRRDILMLLLPTYGGLRAGEAARLHPRDCIDGFMHVTGKGSKQRDVPIHPLLARAMEHFDPNEYFFPSDMSITGHVLPASLGRRVRDLLDMKGWNAHTLRHRFATEVYGKDPDLLALRDLLGHASVSTTEIYTQTKAGRLVQHVNNLTDFAGAGLFEKEMLALP